MPALCLGTFLVVWIMLAIAPHDRTTWALENTPTLVGVPVAVVSFRRFRFSDRAYVRGTVLLVLHTIGSYYTYSAVPVGAWARDAFSLERNHYDRVIHFAFGLLMLLPIRELGFRNARPLSLAVAFFSVAGVGFWSACYEVVEWLVAITVDPAAGKAYLGTQGDVWDAEKDMAAALFGAALAALIECRRETRASRATGERVCAGMGGR